MNRRAEDLALVEQTRASGKNASGRMNAYPVFSAGGPMDDSSTDARERSKEKPPSTISKHGTPGGTARPSGRLQLLEAVASMDLPFVRQDIAGRMTRARARGFDVTKPAAST